MAEFNAGEPSIARVYDYPLGGEVGDRTRDMYNSQGPSGLRSHSPDEFAGFFGDLEIVPPGLGQAQEYRPGWPEMPVSPPRGGQVLVGIGRVRR